MRILSWWRNIFLYQKSTFFKVMKASEYRGPTVKYYTLYLFDKSWIIHNWHLSFQERRSWDRTWRDRSRTSTIVAIVNDLISCFVVCLFRGCSLIMLATEGGVAGLANIDIGWQRRQGYPCLHPLLRIGRNSMFCTLLLLPALWHWDKATHCWIVWLVRAGHVQGGFGPFLKHLDAYGCL